MRKWIVLSVALLSMSAQLLAEGYKGRWEVGGVYGGILFEGSSFLNEDEIYGGQVGYNLTENWGVQLGVLGGDVDLQVPSANRKPINAESPTSEVNVLIPSLELHYNFGTSRFRPYVAAGIGDLHLNPDSNSKTYGVSGKKRDDFIVQYGLGVKWLLNSWLMTRVDLRHIINTEFNYTRFGMPEHQGTATAGLSVLFGGCCETPKKSEPVAQPKVEESVKVVEAPKPVDSDGDGVTDDKDECPGTPVGTKVDSTGCPETVKAIEDNWVLSGVNFETGSDKIKAGSYSVLDSAADILKARSRVRVEIQGHTDSVGNDAANQALSEKRAMSVKNYLVGKGVSVSQLETKGLGETTPVADNNTAEGRASNRRIEFKVLSR